MVIFCGNYTILLNFCNFAGNIYLAKAFKYKKTNHINKEQN